METNKNKSFKEKLKDTYRLVILNNDTFQEISSHRLSLLNIYILLSSFVVVLSALLILLIVFTPIKKLIPGYGEVGQNAALIELNKELDNILQEKEAEELYLEKFRSILVSDDNTDDTEMTEEQKLSVAIDNAIRNNESLVEEVLTIEPINKRDQRVVESTADFIKPLSGTISAPFMPDKKHNGVDILAPSNTAVKSVMDGYVIISGWNIDTGNTIGIQHADNIVSFYKHNSALLKEEGNFVKAGEALAIIGNTGTLSDGPHLHFELWFDGSPVNPENFIKF